MLRIVVSIWTLIAIFGAAAVSSSAGQSLTRTFRVESGARLEVVNRYGRVEAVSQTAGSDENAPAKSVGVLTMNADSSTRFAESDLSITSSRSLVSIEVKPKDPSRRVDLTFSLPPKMRVKVEALAGEVRVSGDIEAADVRTDTGTIALDIPADRVRYSILWTASRPRYLSDFPLTKIKERSAGKFQIAGTYIDPDGESTTPIDDRTSEAAENEDGKKDGQEDDTPEKKRRDGAKGVSLTLETARGIVLLNVPPNEVTGDLRERPLTDAAKAIIRSGDSLLMEAIRRAAPRYYGDYTRTLPPLKLEPNFSDRTPVRMSAEAVTKVASVQVSDVNNRALADLTPDDFEVLEGGTKREIVSVKRSTAAFNLVLLLDVSGSVDNYVTFIRKAARSFVNTVDPADRVAIVTFNDDVHPIAKFTTDKSLLSASLDSFDAGGATAYYDALGYTLADTLRPLRGQRTAVVILTDGDDNRSFLPFDSMLASIQESGALIYPLYVPSGLIAASESPANPSVDALRTRYLQGELTSKARSEGEQLAKVSGGVYYEISKLSQIDEAYAEIVRQLRTAYDIEYRSGLLGADAGISPRLGIRAKRPNTFVQIRSVAQR